MEEIFTFTKENNKKQEILLPSDYDTDIESIPGIYFTSSIRFYKNKIEGMYEEIKNNSNLSNRDKRNLLRIIHASMADFKIIDDNKIYLKKTGTSQDECFNFKNGIILAKCSNFTDVIEKTKLEEYLDLYGFEKEYKDEILSSESSSFKRTPNKQLKFNFMYKIKR